MQFMLWAISVRMPERPMPDRWDRSRLWGLISMYFPEGIAVLEEHDAKAAKIATANFKTPAKGSVAKDAAHFEAVTVACAVKTQELTTATAKRLRAVVKKSAGPSTG